MLYSRLLFLLNLRRPPATTLFPYTTLFRSFDTLVGLEQQLLGQTATVIGDQVVEAHAGHGQTFAQAPRRHIQAAGDLLQRHSTRSEEHTSELQSRENLVCRLLLEKKNRPQR